MMYAIQLDMYQAAAVAALVLLLGRFLVRNLDLLRRYCIPEPVAGGVVFALAHLALRQAGIWKSPLTPRSRPFLWSYFSAAWALRPASAF